MMREVAEGTSVSPHQAGAGTESLLARVLSLSEHQQGAWTQASVLHYPGGSGIAGPYQGRDSVLALLRRLAELSDDTFVFEPGRLIAEDAAALIRAGRSRGSRAGRELNVATMQVLSLSEGEVREAWLFYADQACVDAFWSD